MSDEISGSSDILPGYHVILIVSLVSVVPGKRCPSGCPIQVALVAERYDFEECGMFSIWCGRVSLALMWCDHIPWPCNVNL